MIPTSNLSLISYDIFGDRNKKLIPDPYIIVNDEFKGGEILLDICNKYEFLEGIRFLGDKTLSVILIKFKRPGVLLPSEICR